MKNYTEEIKSGRMTPGQAREAEQRERLDYWIAEAEKNRLSMTTLTTERDELKQKLLAKLELNLELIDEKIILEKERNGWIEQLKNEREEWGRITDGLKKELNMLRKFYECWKDEVHKIAINAELLVALKAITTECWKSECLPELVERAHEVIAKAEKK